MSAKKAADVLLAAVKRKRRVTVSVAKLTGLNDCCNVAFAIFI